MSLRGFLSGGRKVSAIACAAFLIVVVAPRVEAAPSSTTPRLSLRLNVTSISATHRFIASVTSDATCTTLTVTFQGQAAIQSGSVLTYTFTAPPVAQSIKVPVAATCDYTPSTGEPRTLRATTYITVLPLVSRPLGTSSPLTAPTQATAPAAHSSSNDTLIIVLGAAAGVVVIGVLGGVALSRR